MFVCHPVTIPVREGLSHVNACSVHSAMCFDEITAACVLVSLLYDLVALKRPFLCVSDA